MQHALTNKNYKSLPLDMSAETLSEKSAITWLAVFMLITVDSSFWLLNIASGTTRIIANITAVILLAMVKQKFVIRTNSISILLYCVVFAMLSGLVFHDIKQTTIILSCIICGWLCTVFICKDSFINMYTKIILFLALFSLVTFVFSIMFKSLMYLLPIVDVRDGISYHNAFFSILSNNSYVSRNYGLFWEPGAFAIFLNIALYLEVLYKKHTNYKHVAILAVTILTTLSTLGIVCMSLLAAALFFQTDVNQKIKIHLIAVFFVAGIFIITSDFFTFHVFGKLQVNQDGALSATTIVRLNSIIYPGIAFLKSIFWGVGYPTFLIIQKEKCFNMATFTYINWLCIYGLLGGAIFCMGCIKFFLQKRRSIIQDLLLVAFSILLFSTENFIGITFIYILIFYSFERPLYVKSNPYAGVKL